MMVRTYPEFAHLEVFASVTGQDGITVRAIYLMVREGKMYHVEGVAGGAQFPADINAPAKDV